jgi:hypothetical protein
MHITRFFFLLNILCALSVQGQQIEKVEFDKNDNKDGYYLSIRPLSGTIKGTIVIFNSFIQPEKLLTETKLHNVAFANDFLTIVLSTKQKFYADTPTVQRLNSVLSDVVSRYKVDSSKIVLAGYDFGGNIALRYVELSNSNSEYVNFRPKAVAVIDSPVDLFGLWKWCKRQLRNKSKKAEEAKYILDLMTKEYGPISENIELYKSLTSFYSEEDTVGNERFLKNIPVRAYYDVDVAWQLENNSNSLYDTNIPIASEFIRRLREIGNNMAEFVSAKQPGLSSKGVRNTNSLSIVDEVEFIHWAKNKLNIFDANTWVPPYYLLKPKGWEVERFPIPIDFAPSISYQGSEDVRFAPGWGDEKSEEYWSYTFLWWLQGAHKIDSRRLKSHLQDYYQGLVQRNISRNNLAANAAIKTRENHTAILFQISPQHPTHQVWKDMGEIANSFNCQ